MKNNVERKKRLGKRQLFLALKNATSGVENDLVEKS